MSGTSVIEIGYKEGAVDPHSRALGTEIRHFGFSKLSALSVSQLYRLDGALSPQDRARVSDDLLCDRVTQRAIDGQAPAVEPPVRRGKAAAAKTVTIDVWYKSGVTDVVGESVMKGIQDLGISGVSDVRTGTRYRLSGIRGKGVAEKISAAFLANPLINDVIIHAD